MTTETLKLVSLNVRGISNFQKRRAIFPWCRKRKTDFTFLQGTHSKKDTEIYWKNEWGTDIVMSHCGSNSCGVGGSNSCDLVQKRCRLCDSHQDS